MNWLRANSRICFIDSDFSVIEQRLSVKPKAVIGLKEKGLRKLWDERIPIYKKWADISVSTHGKDLARIADEIISRLSVNS
jgi:shikimate kinase